MKNLAKIMVLVSFFAVGLNLTAFAETAATTSTEATISTTKTASSTETAASIDSSDKAKKDSSIVGKIKSKIKKQTVSKIKKQDKKFSEIDIVCAQQIIEKRDSVIIGALDAYYAAQKTNLSNRKEALKTGWGISGQKERRAVLKKAWEDFRKSSKEARQTFNKAKKDAWKQFSIDRKSCGGKGASDDPGNEGFDSQL